MSLTTSQGKYPQRVSLKSGVSDVASVHPELMNLWSPRNEKSPSEFHHGSNKYAYWLCETNGHEIYRMIRLFVKNPKICSVCAGQEILPGFNGLAITHPEIAAQWDIERNRKSPAEVSAGSKTSVFWLCPSGHSYKAQPHNRKNGRGCPICFGRVALAGFNDLASKHPELLEEWNPRNTLKPTEITSGSGKLVWWQCRQCEHEWAARPAHRTVGHGCPECGSKSRLEERVAFFLKNAGISYRRRYRGIIDEDGHRRELDFLLEDLGLAFEVQDFATHSKDSDFEETEWVKRFGLYKNGPTYHRKKQEAAKRAGFKLTELWQDEILNENFKMKIIEEINNVANGR